MSKKREKEETELKVPETLSLCTPSITAKISVSDEYKPDLKSGGNVDCRSSFGGSLKRPDLHQTPPEPKADSPEENFKRRVVNRCSGCRKKVGLIGFRCRCGEMFCSDHRYSDRHDCSFDYKAAGREAIARENPVVRAAKILKV